MTVRLRDEEDVDGLLQSAIEESLQRWCPGVEVKFPAVREGKVVGHHPFSSFVFVRADRPIEALRAVVRSGFVENILPEPLTQVQLTRMLNRCTTRFRPGTPVTVAHGEFAGVCGKVATATTKRVAVRVQLHSGTRLIHVWRDDLE